MQWFTVAWKICDYRRNLWIKLPWRTAGLHRLTIDFSRLD